MNAALANHSDDAIGMRLHAMLAYRLGRQESEIQDHLHLVNELYVDSLDLVEIEIGISEMFDIHVSEKELLDSETVGDLSKIVKFHLEEKRAADSIIAG
ncbi:phosphopantetheine-binding protein [Acerihabitans sp. KWT182]|uniref:Phosphopantetheine-binding protein n=1 Tax=Acerihabitans sp. KWT182 TaxID=3157919 RepID=A0AAU7QAP4_9GAMM